MDEIRNVVDKLGTEPLDKQIAIQSSERKRARVRIQWVI